MKNPDKYIRKFFNDSLSGMIVNGKQVKLYDVSTPNNEDVLIILSTQSGSDDRVSKCSLDLNRTILIDIITRYKGNIGSRALLDDIVEEVLQRTHNINVENFTVQDYRISYPGDIVTSTTTETIYRKIINYSINLK